MSHNQNKHPACVKRFVSYVGVPVLMQFIQRARWPVFTRDVRLRRVRRAARRVMRHVGLAGQCDCVLTRDEQGNDGVLLHVETRQCVPPVERPQLQAYFRRKLFELDALGERGQLPFRLHIVDGNDLACVGNQPVGHVSSRRVAAILRRANPEALAPAPHADRVTQLRQHLSARRRERFDSDFSPLQVLPLTDLSPLGEA